MPVSAREAFAEIRRPCTRALPGLPLDTALGYITHARRMLFL